MITQETYPKFYRMVSDWINSKSQMQGITPEMSKLLDPTKMVDMIVKTNARALYDILDDHGVHVGVWHSGDGWRYNVHAITGAKWNVADSHIGGNTRMETEGIAFEQAAKIIESR